MKKGVKGGYQCGHIISEYNGGATEPFNMRPICSGCNQGMGNMYSIDEWDLIWCDKKKKKINIFKKLRSGKKY